MDAPPFRDLVQAALDLAERHPAHQAEARQRVLDLIRPLQQQGTTRAPLATHRVVYIHHLSNEVDRPSKERVDWYAAYELTSEGLTPVWAGDPENRAAATDKPEGLVYREKPASVPAWSFRIQGGNFDKPHAIASNLAAYWGEPVGYKLLNGFHPHLDTVRPTSLVQS